MTGTLRVQELALEFSSCPSSRSITDCTQSWDDSFLHMPSGIVLITLSITTVCQCRHKLHKPVTPSGINVLNCIPCVWPPAVEQNYCIHHNKLWDITADLLSEVCRSVSTEPCLQPVKAWRAVSTQKREQGRWSKTGHDRKLLEERSTMCIFWCRGYSIPSCRAFMLSSLLHLLSSVALN